MKALEDAIYGALSGDGTLTALLSAATAIFPDRAPKTAGYPYIIFSLQPPSTDEYVYTGRAYEELDYLIKAVDQGMSNLRADAAMERVDTLLTQGLTVSGYTVGMVQRHGRINYPEDGDAGDHYSHRGGVWRFMLDPN